MSSQQYSYLPNGQVAPQLQNFQSQPTHYANGFPAGYGQPAALSRPGGMPGMDPAMLAAAQQSMLNPDAGDGFDSIFPGPKAAALGAVGGASVAYALNQLEQRKVFDGIANKLDRIPGIRHASDAMTGYMKKASSASSGFWANPGWRASSLRELLQTHTFTAAENELAALPHGASEEVIQEAAKRAAAASVREMQKRQLTSTLGHLSKNFEKKPNLTDAYKTLHAGLDKDAINLLESENWLKVADKATFEHVLAQTNAQIKVLDAIKKKSGAQKSLSKVLYNLKERISGLNEHHLPLYKEQAELSARLQLKGTGPVGRMFATSVNYMKRIFNGETLRIGGKAAGGAAEKTFVQSLKSTLSRFALPGLAGAMIFGSSIQKAEKAKDGEKTKTFFHDFLGTGIGNFVGWEFGRKVLNSFQFSDKVLRGGARKTLPRIFGRAIPLIGGITLGGFVTEILAMFVIGGIFQSGFEKISNAIFGKPSKEKDKAKTQQNLLQPNAAMANMAAQQVFRQGQFQGLNREEIRQRLPKPLPRRPDPNIAPSPDVIRQSGAAQYHAQMEESVINSPWDYSNHIDPFDKHGI